MKKLLFSIIVILFFLPAMASETTPTTNEKTENKSGNKEGKENKPEKDPKKLSFIDYFNLLPKISREFALSDAFDVYEGYEIRNIDIFVLDRFVDPISKKSIQNFEETDSTAHKANKKLVHRQLIFKEGNKIDPILMSDAERYLRENTIYTDAYITLHCTELPNLVDVEIYVQDNRHWRAIFWASPTSISVGAGFHDFAGLPQRLEIMGSGLFSKNNPYSFDIKYRLKNIAKSQIDLETQFFKQNIAQTSQFKLGKEFVTYNTKWAGSFDIKHTIRKETENGFADEISSDYNMGLVSKDTWIARSFAMPNANRSKTSRLVVSARATVNKHLFIPEDLPIQNYVDRQFYLGSFGLASREWYGIEELYRFRDFDYIPKGFNFALLGGYEVNEFLGGRIYSGATVNYSKMFEKFGYIQNELRYGAFLRNNNYEQITAQHSLNYFTKRFEIGKLGFRQFVKAKTTLSYDRPDTEFFSLSESIRGLRSNNINMFGTKSFVLNFESVFYTPIKWWTSRGNFFLFADLGVVSKNEKQLLFKNTIHQGYGAGIRFQNLATTINYMQISIGYYPTGQMVNLNPVGFNLQANPDRMIETNSLFKSGIMSGL